uniref:Uncharacterized protein n=1 Tax=Anguilla anguilla TaxID=7936 RepID=A0A0E9QCL6_ANGAN
MYCLQGWLTYKIMWKIRILNSCNG